MNRKNAGRKLMTAEQFKLISFYPKLWSLFTQAREIMQGLEFSDIVMYVGTIKLV